MSKQIIKKLINQNFINEKIVEKIIKKKSNLNFKRIVIDGNLGSGKSTLINKLKKKLNNGKINFIQEDINLWQSYLDDYYKNINNGQSALRLQCIVLHHFINSKFKENNCNKFTVYERSPLSCINIFSELLLQSKILESKDLMLLKQINKDLGWTPDVIIYLQCNVKTSCERISKRNRSTEKEKIDTGYITKIHELYENLYINNENNIVIIINAEDDENIVFKKVLDILKIFL